MPPKKSITLTEAELRLMKVLWERGESAVADLVTAVSDERPLAYTSVLTTVRILENKGYVRHRQEGRAFLYSPCVDEFEASKSEVRHMLQRFFGNSRERLLLSLLGDDEISPDELQRLREAIAAAPDSAPYLHAPDLHAPDLHAPDQNVPDQHASDRHIPAHHVPDQREER